MRFPPQQEEGKVSSSARRGQGFLFSKKRVRFPQQEEGEVSSSARRVRFPLQQGQGEVSSSARRE